MATAQSPAARRLLALGNGGHVRGPGTATSDSIPARLSDGEFVLPADTVKKVGVKSLRDLVARTHTPTGKGRPDHYADGGLVDDPGAVTRVGNSYSGMDVRGNITVNGQAPGGTFSENAGMRPPPVPAPGATATAGIPPAAPSIAQPASIQPGTAAGRTATPGTPTAGTAATPAAPAQMDWAQRNAQRSLEVTASSILPSKARDDAQAQLGLTAKPPGAAPQGDDLPQPETPGLPSRRPAPTIGSPAAPLRSAFGAPQPRGYADGGLVEDERSRAALVDQIPTDGYRETAPIAPDGSQNNPFNNELGRNVLNTLSAVPGAGSMLKSGRMVGLAAQSLGAAREVGAVNAAQAGLRAVAAPVIGGYSVSSAGSAEQLAAAQTSPSPAVANRASGLAHYNEGEMMGPPSEAKPAAATARVAAPAASAPQPAGNDAYARLVAIASGAAPTTPAVQAPVVRHSGNDWQARNDLRNAAVSASSIMNTREWGGSGAENSPAMQEYRALLAADQAARQAVPATEVAAMRERAGLQREGMEQQGHAQRAALGALGTAEANQIARGRLSLEQIAAGYQNRAAGRLESAQLAVENATTPEEQRSARQRLLTLLGKDGEDRWKAVALQGGTDAQGNKTDSILGAVNERTGEMRRMGAQAQANAAPADGSMVRGKDGRLYEVKNGRPVPVGN